METTNQSGQAQSPAGQPRVMAVDDSPIALKKFAMVLNANGFEFHPVQDPKMAIEAIAEFRPDIILMDQLMPGIDGFELTGMIMKEKGMEKIKIIMISADLKKETVVRAVQSGAVDFLLKPFEDSALVAKINQYLPRK